MKLFFWTFSYARLKLAYLVLILVAFTLYHAHKNGFSLDHPKTLLVLMVACMGLPCVITFFGYLKILRQLREKEIGKSEFLAMSSADRKSLIGPYQMF